MVQQVSKLPAITQFSNIASEDSKAQFATLASAAPSNTLIALAKAPIATPVKTQTLHDPVTGLPIQIIVSKGRIAVSVGGKKPHFYPLATTLPHIISMLKNPESAIAQEAKSLKQNWLEKSLDYTGGVFNISGHYSSVFADVTKNSRVIFVAQGGEALDLANGIVGSVKAVPQLVQQGMRDGRDIIDIHTGKKKGSYRAAAAGSTIGAGKFAYGLINIIPDLVTRVVVPGEGHTYIMKGSEKLKNKLDNEYIKAMKQVGVDAQSPSYRASSDIIQGSRQV
jgi:hypothetical protein